MRQFRYRGDQVEVVGVSRGQPERLLFAAAAEHDRDVVAEARLVDRALGVIPLAGERGPFAVGHRDDDLKRLLELLESLGERVEFEAELLVFELEPAGADAEDRPAAADHVQRRDGLGEQRRVAVGIAGDQRRQLDVLGRARQRPERGVRLEHRLVWFAQRWQLVEVVHHQDRVEACGLGLLGLRLHGRKSSATGVP